MKKIGAFLSFLFLSVSLFSFDMILTGDPVLEDLRFLSLKSGRSILSFTPPFAPAEIRRFLDSIDETTLSQSAREAYQRVLRRLTPASRISFVDDNFSVRLDINSTVEGEARFNTEISWFPRYQHVTPLISLPLRGSFMNTAQLYFEPILARASHRYGEDTFNTSVLPGFAHGQLNREMSIRAFAAAGGNWWNFQIGRDRLFWGTGHTGSLIFSDHSPYFDFARLSVFSANIKYSIIVNQMPLRLSQNIFTNEWWEAHSNYIDIHRTVLQRYFYLQRLDIRLFNRLSIGIMEGIMVGNSPLELRYLNPIIFYHSLWAWNDFPNWGPDNHNGDMVGSFFSLEVNWNIARNLAIYGQFAMNEFSLPGEEDGHPDAMGWMAGIQFAHSFNNWGSVSFLEFVYTDPFLSILSTPYTSFIHMDRAGNYYFIGFPRDTIAVTLGTNFFYRNILNLTGRFSWIASGEHNNNEETNGLTWDWGRGPEFTERRTPSGTAEHRFALSFGSTWRPQPWLSLGAGITGIVALNTNHISGNTQIGGQASLSAEFRW